MFASQPPYFRVIRWDGHTAERGLDTEEDARSAAMFWTGSHVEQQPQHNGPNPILVKLREQRPAFTGPHAEVHAFDNANGAAWVEAGEPDDTPGSQWVAYERHAYRIIERLAALS